MLACVDLAQIGALALEFHASLCNFFFWLMVVAFIVCVLINLISLEFLCVYVEFPCILVLFFLPSPFTRSECERK